MRKSDGSLQTIPLPAGILSAVCSPAVNGESELYLLRKPASGFEILGYRLDSERIFTRKLPPRTLTVMLSAMQGKTSTSSPRPVVLIRERQSLKVASLKDKRLWSIVSIPGLNKSEAVKQITSGRSFDGRAWIMLATNSSRYLAYPE